MLALTFCFALPCALLESHSENLGFINVVYFSTFLLINSCATWFCQNLGLPKTFYADLKNLFSRFLMFYNLPLLPRGVRDSLPTLGRNRIVNSALGLHWQHISEVGVAFLDCHCQEGGKSPESPLIFF